MCQYSSTDGYANDWHFVHLGSQPYNRFRKSIKKMKLLPLQFR